MTTNAKPSSSRSGSAIALLKAMHSIRMEEVDESLLYARLEAEVLAIIPDCEAEELVCDLSTYLAGSAAVIRALPARKRYKRAFESEHLRFLMKSMPVEAFGVAIEKRFLLAGFAHRLLAHRPGEQEWTEYLCNVLSPRSHFGRDLMWNLWSSLDLLDSDDHDRVLKVLQAQVRDHPFSMQSEVSGALNGTDRGRAIAAALILCGAPLDNVSPHDDADRAFLENAASNHGKMSLAAEYGPLEKAVARIVKT